jgi:hypothetical protein
MSFTVTITGVTTPIEVYAGLPAVLDFLGAEPTAIAAAFLVLDADTQKRNLVAATRYIERKRWQGTPKLVGTTLRFPMSGLDGDPSDAVQLAALTGAVSWLAAISADDDEALAQRDQASNIQRAGAGGAEVDFFAPTTTNSGTASVLPVAVDDLVGQWLDTAGATTATGGYGQTGASASCSLFARQAGR